MQEQETMRIIKKYQNRKLYDTTDSCYITLDDIATLIRKGEEVRVIDNKTKGDVTSVILTQILVDQEKSAKSILPLTMLRDIIRQGKGSLYEFIQRYVVLGINNIEQKRIEAGRYIDQLVARGDLTKDEGQNLLNQVMSGEDAFQADVNDWIGNQVNRSLRSVGKFSEIETHIQALNQKIATLESKLATYER